MEAGRRRLAAILAADVAGYSRLIGMDEEGVIADLQQIKADIVGPCLTKHHGRIANTAGDSLLIEFQSVVDAVRAALAIQADIAVFNREVGETRRLELRMGVHVGDVVADGADMLGDGVNVAARIEGLAQPGGLCISRSALEQVQDRLSLNVKDLGEIAVKNIARPVHVFAVDVAPSSDGQATSTPVFTVKPTMEGSRRRLIAMAATVAITIAAGAVFWTWGPFDAETAISQPNADAPFAIAVLPFVDQSDDGGQAYFAQGVAEDIGTELARLDALTVTAPAATEGYRGVHVDPRDAAKALSVSAVLEGSVRRVGGKLRVTARLVDGATGGQMWAERYDRSDDDIFSIQDDIAGRVAQALSLELGAVRQARGRTPDIEAYDAYIAGRAKRIPPTPQNLAAAMIFFERAMAKDPEFAGGFSGASFVQGFLAYLPAPPATPKTLIAQSLALAEKAVALDPGFGPAHGALAEALLRSRRYEAALDASRTAVRLAPNDSLMRAHLARLLNFMSRSVEAEAETRQALRMSPDSPPPLFVLGVAQRMQGKFDAAIDTLREHRERLGGKIAPEPNLHLAAALAASGQIAEARGVIQSLSDAIPGITLAYAIRTQPFQEQADADAFESALRRAGLPDGV